MLFSGVTPSRLAPLFLLPNLECMTYSFTANAADFDYSNIQFTQLQGTGENKKLQQSDDFQLSNEDHCNC